jgi:hypothetical protein
MDAANAFILEIKNEIEREAEEEQKQTINRYPGLLVYIIKGDVYKEVNHAVLQLRRK